MIKPRYKRFLEELPLHKNKVIPSAIIAGYSEKYARARGKTLMENAIKANARDLIKSIENKEITKDEAIQAMYENVGFTKDDMINNVRYLATQERDLATRLRVITPLVKSIVDLSQQDTPNVSVPILNLTFSKPDDDIIPIEHKDIEP